MAVLVLVVAVVEGITVIYCKIVSLCTKLSACVIMPAQRGILGVAKDPKRPLLFTYGGEDWPSDDSEDSDYELPEDKVDPKKSPKKYD